MATFTSRRIAARRREHQHLADLTAITGVSAREVERAGIYAQWFGPGVIWVERDPKRTVFRTWAELAACGLRVGNLPQNYEVGKETLFLIRRWWGQLVLYRIEGQVDKDLAPIATA